MCGVEAFRGRNHRELEALGRIAGNEESRNSRFSAVATVRLSLLRNAKSEPLDEIIMLDLGRHKEHTIAFDLPAILQSDSPQITIVA